MKRFVFCCALAVLFLLLGTTAEAQSVEQVGKYYSDATYTTIVGGKWFDCCGGVVVWGQYTSYQVWEQYPCGECFPYGECGWDPYCGNGPYNPTSSKGERSQSLNKAAFQRAFGTAHGTPGRCSRDSI